jgi:hypothetical protein
MRRFVLIAVLVWSAQAHAESGKPIEETRGSEPQPAQVIFGTPPVTCPGTLDTTDATFNRALTFAQGGTCTLSAVGTAVRYRTLPITVAATGNVTVSLVDADGASITPAQADTFLMLYPAGGFNPATPCTNAIAANDDAVGTRSRIITTTPLAAGVYTVVVTSFANVPAAPGALPWTYNVALAGAVCGAAVAPTVAYNPTAGSDVAFTGVTTIGTTGNGTIVATPSGGVGTGAGATTTINGCTLGGANPSAFAGAAAVNLSFEGNATTAQNINLTCTSQQAAQAATLTCNETRGTAAAVPRQWPLTCPAGTPVAPTIAYNPTAGSTVAFTGVTTIGTAGNGTIAATPSGGLGTGAGATTTISGCTLGGANPSAFAGAAAVNLSFEGNTTTAQNINLTCTSQQAVQTATLTCNETRGAAAAVQRQWPLSCPLGTLLPLGATPASGATVTVAGAPGGPTPSASIALSNPNPIAVTVTCSAPAAPFAVAPIPLSIPAGGNASLVVSVNAGPGSYSGSLSCAVQGSTQVLTYSLSGTIAQAAPVDATSGWSRGLLLLLVLIAGLGAAAYARRP